MSNRVVVTIPGEPGPPFARNPAGNRAWVRRGRVDARRALCALRVDGAISEPFPSNVAIEACFYGVPSLSDQLDNLVNLALDVVVGSVIWNENQVRMINVFRLPAGGTIEGARTILTVINLDPLQAIIGAAEARA